MKKTGSKICLTVGRCSPVYQIVQIVLYEADSVNRLFFYVSSRDMIMEKILSGGS